MAKLEVRYNDQSRIVDERLIKIAGKRPHAGSTFMRAPYTQVLEWSFDNRDEAIRIAAEMNKIPTVKATVFN